MFAQGLAWRPFRMQHVLRIFFLSERLQTCLFKCPQAIHSLRQCAKNKSKARILPCYQSTFFHSFTCHGIFENSRVGKLTGLHAYKVCMKAKDGPCSGSKVVSASLKSANCQPSLNACLWQLRTFDCNSPSINRPIIQPAKALRC